MNMKKCFLLAVVMLLWIPGQMNAQSDGLSVIVGYNNPIFRDFSGPNGGRPAILPGVESKILYKGVKIGVMYDAPIVAGFGVSMGLNYSYGSNITSWITKGYAQFRSVSNIHSLEVPVDWQYKFEIATNTYVMVYTGPTVQVHLHGCDKEQRLQLEEKTVEREYDLFSEDKDRGYGVLANQRYNIFWGVGLGFQYDRYFVRGGYDFGLINAYKNNKIPDTDLRLSGRLDQWQIKLGIYLWSPND